ncbi:MAG: hypothetical protein U1F68_11450 [Gammaproteobacteria bacterium]
MNETCAVLAKGAVLACALTLYACASPQQSAKPAAAAEQLAPAPPPPDLQPVPEDGGAPSADETSPSTANARAAQPATAEQKAAQALFPGFKNKPGTAKSSGKDGATAQDTPFEEGIAKRRKRAYLGLEPQPRTPDPVPNVLDLKF